MIIVVMRCVSVIVVVVVVVIVVVLVVLVLVVVVETDNKIQIRMISSHNNCDPCLMKQKCTSIS